MHGLNKIMMLLLNNVAFSDLDGKSESEVKHELELKMETDPPVFLNKFFSCLWGYQGIIGMQI